MDNKQPFHKSAFLIPSTSVPRRSRPTRQAACARPMNAAQSSSRQPANQPANQPSPPPSTNIPVNENIPGVVTRVTSFGAFVDIGNGHTGLVHISEIADTFVRDINQHVTIGQRLTVRVLSVDPVKNRIGLSIRKAVPMSSGYDRVIELGGDWGHPWGDDGQTKFVDLGPRPEPGPQHWEPDPALFQRWDTAKDRQ